MPISRIADTAARAPILLTMGDPCGVGPEICVSAFTALHGEIAGRPLRIVGDPAAFAALPSGVLIPTRPAANRHPRQADPANAPAILEAIEAAVSRARAGEAAAIVTAPIHKASLLEAGFAFPGHTEYLAHLTGAPRAVMMLAGGGLRVVPLTIHVPYRDVPTLITHERIVETAHILLSALLGDFGLAAPRLAIAGLNPHAGEQGEIGREEAEIIAPAAEFLRAEGHAVIGPLPPDTMFHAEARSKYDAAICMYHDQALIPLKTLAFWEGVNVTLGLPIVRTSPDHGTAFDIAGKGRADPRSMIAAIRLAADIADARGL